nr:MAG TPA: hypothetical protein [Caudoviricetes sp.]
MSGLIELNRQIAAPFGCFIPGIFERNEQYASNSRAALTPGQSDGHTTQTVTLSRAVAICLYPRNHRK